VIHSLIDIVSKNGNLLLNIPLRGDGTIDEDERRFLGEIATWIPAHGEAIFGTRPFTVSGEGPPSTAKTTDFNERNARPYTSEDIRFTSKGGTLYATALGWPENGTLTVKTLAENSPQYPRRVQGVELIGHGPVPFKQEGNGLALSLPERKPNPYAYVFKIS
jgi:alpha-L-fucosidase